MLPPKRKGSDVSAYSELQTSTSTIRGARLLDSSSVVNVEGKTFVFLKRACGTDLSRLDSMAADLVARAGLPTGDTIKYELDHFVPLAIGGHPRSEDNLWLQRWDGAWNARVEDRRSASCR